MHPTVVETPSCPIGQFVDQVLNIYPPEPYDRKSSPDDVSFFTTSQNNSCPSATLAVQCSAAKSLASSVMNLNARQRTEWRWQMGDRELHRYAIPLYADEFAQL